jgi:hypothetical protein
MPYLLVPPAQQPDYSYPLHLGYVMATVLSAKQGLLKIADASAARVFIAQLTGATPAQRQAQLLMQLQLLNEAGVTGTPRLQVLELLRETTLEAQHARSKECWGRPVPFDHETRDIFNRSISLWRALADAYESLITDMAESSPEVAGHAALVCYRALRYTGFGMNAYNRAYHAVPGFLWEQLHRLYAFAESAGIIDTPVAESADGKSTVNLAYLHIVLTQCASPDSLSLLQMDIIDRALAQWVPLGGISMTPVATDANVALGIDLGSSEGAHRLKNLKGNNLRYLDLEKIGDKLRKTAVALKSQSPDKLGLGPVPREACERLMLHLHSQWIAPGTGRVDERKVVSFNALVSYTMAAMHYNISGKPFSAPDAGLHSRARFEMAGFQRVDGPVVGEASVRSRTLETWTVVNQSASGILGMCHKLTENTRLTHNQLLGLVAPNGNNYLGFVQRLSVDTEGMTWLGLRLLRAKVQPIAARVADNQTPYDRALLLADVPGGEPQTVLVAPGTYSPGRVLDIHDGKPRQIRLTALLESGSNFERVTYNTA